jgi:O-antigen ligase
VSLNGFFLYLGGLRLLGVSPHRATTGVWYGLIGTLCLAGVWINRETLRSRLVRASRPLVAYVGAGAVLSIWFLVNVAVISHGALPHTFAAQLVLWTLPSALLALSMPRRAIPATAAAVGALGILFVLIEIVAIARNPHAVRFSPIRSLDPISAAQYPALGALALITLMNRGARTAKLAVAVALLCAGTVVPGSRGPVLALVAGLLVGVALVPRRVLLLLVPAIAAGLAIGYGATKAIGSSDYLTSSIPGEISTFHIRKEWWTTAAKAIPDDPIVGHGVAMFVDNTPEAKRMGVAGERTYPHNSPLESLYSLGILGALPYLILIGSGITALVLLLRRRAGMPLVFAAGVYAFAFASANLSGEIGADAALWAAGALAVGLYAEATAESR